jgi:hypothetical protein
VAERSVIAKPGAQVDPTRVLDHLVWLNADSSGGKEVKNIGHKPVPSVTEGKVSFEKIESFGRSANEHRLECHVLG